MGVRALLARQDREIHDRRQERGLPQGQSRAVGGCARAPSTMAPSTRTPPASFQASTASASNSTAATSAVMGTAAVVRPASHVSTWGKPRYQSQRQKTLAESAYQVASIQVDPEIAPTSNGSWSNASGAAQVNPTKLAPSASRSG